MLYITELTKRPAIEPVHFALLLPATLDAAAFDNLRFMVRQIEIESGQLSRRMGFAAELTAYQYQMAMIHGAEPILFREWVVQVCRNSEDFNILQEIVIQLYGQTTEFLL